MVSALLLSAGRSRRMGWPKALLPWARRLTLLEHTAGEVHPACQELVAVVSPGAVHLEAERLGLRSAVNPAPEDGLLSSVKAGLAAVSAEASGVLITLVDLPWLTTDDFRRLPKRDHLSRYLYGDQPAHPAWIPRRYFDEILSAPQSEKGCAFLFEKYSDAIVWVEAPTANGLRDIDTPEDYNAHVAP